MKMSPVLEALTVGQWVYLQRTVHTDLRRKREALEKFAPRPGQDSALADKARLQLQEKVTFLEDMYRILRDNKPRQENGDATHQSNHAP